VSVIRDQAPASAPETALSGNETIDRLRSDVARAVRKICPRWLVDQIDDLTQVATARLIQRIRDTAGTSVVLTDGYIYRTAYTALVDEIRRRRRLHEIPIESDLVPASPAEDPDRRLTARTIRDAVAKCLAALMASRRRAVMLRLQGHSLDDLSAFLDCSRKKAENLVYRGLAELRACLRAKGVEP
jgi:RNA polymerase sigma-70 factor (ECF subfamily)